jgi:Zn-dependent M28 family amino/carboxypeptidase
VSEKASDPFARADRMPGANDGASGVAVLLTLADELARTPPGIGVDILLTDGEDWGHDTETLATDTTDMFIGARHFARTRGAAYRPLYGILLDIVGGQGARFLYEGHSLNYAPEVVGRVWRTAADLGHADVFVQASGHYSTDDHVPLNQAGIRTIDIIDSGFINGPYWHTTEDTVDKISAETLDAVGEVVLEVIRREGSGR